MRTLLFSVLVASVPACGGMSLSVGSSSPPSEDASDAGAGPATDATSSTPPDDDAGYPSFAPEAGPPPPMCQLLPGPSDWVPTQISLGDNSAVSGTSASNVWFAGPNVIAHWDGTMLLQDVTVRGSGAVAAVSASDVWANGLANTSLKELWHWDGLTWTVLPQQAPPPDAGPDAGSPPQVAHLWSIASNDVWGVGGAWGSSALFHYDGQAWSTTPVGSANAVWALGANDVWIGAEGAIRHWDGVAWSDVLTQAGVTFGPFAGTSSSDVWAVTSQSSVVHWDGAQWMHVALPDAQDRLDGVWAAAPNDVWAVGMAPQAGGALLCWAIFHYDGVAWAQVPAPVSDNYWAIWGSSAHDIWIAGSYYVLHRTK